MGVFLSKNFYNAPLCFIHFSYAIIYEMETHEGTSRISWKMELKRSLMQKNFEIHTFFHDIHELFQAPIYLSFLFNAPVNLMKLVERDNPVGIFF